CEHCAGRGLIVHHDPVFKHRSSNEAPSNGGAGGSSRSRRGRGGGGGGSAGSGVKNGIGGAGTHAITEDVKNALAQIAKSTVHTEGDSGPSESVAAASPAEQAAVAA